MVMLQLTEPVDNVESALKEGQETEGDPVLYARVRGLKCRRRSDSEHTVNH